ncbi:MAG: NADH-quinone oxidoreductase subunit NuoE [Alphaproteobacteria bacterium]|nr:NADH-quinone oxidoreductase subunit NuoE [Alphaproteobacteria bacterium]
MSVKNEIFTFSPENLSKIKEIIANFPKGCQASAVLPLLDLAQRQCGGWLKQGTIECVASMLEMPEMKVLEVASFYSMFNLQPVGEHHVQVCTTTPCWLRGSDEILQSCKQILGIETGQVTKDGKFSLVEVECLGACVKAPMVQINDDYYEDLTPESMAKLLAELGKQVKET